jgi:hypothetical protein
VFVYIFIYIRILVFSPLHVAALGIKVRFRGSLRDRTRLTAEDTYDEENLKLPMRVFHPDGSHLSDHCAGIYLLVTGSIAALFHLLEGK